MLLLLPLLLSYVAAVIVSIAPVVAFAAAIAVNLAVAPVMASAAAFAVTLAVAPVAGVTVAVDLAQVVPGEEVRQRGRRSRAQVVGPVERASPAPVHRRRRRGGGAGEVVVVRPLRTVPEAARAD